MKKFWIIFFGLLWTLASCAPQTIGEISPVETKASPTSTLAPVKEAVNSPLEPDSLNSAPEIPHQETDVILLQAKKMLAEKLEISVEKINLVDIQAIDWPDASLGCPQSGMVYAQVITPGYRITLEANKKLYFYHTGKKEQLIFCAREMSFPVTPGEIQDDIPWMPVDNPEE